MARQHSPKVNISVAKPPLKNRCGLSHPVTSPWKCAVWTCPLATLLLTWKVLQSSKCCEVQGLFEFFSRKRSIILLLLCLWCSLWHFYSERLALPRDLIVLAWDAGSSPGRTRGGLWLLSFCKIVSLFKIITEALLLHSLPSPTSWPLLRVTSTLNSTPKAWLSSHTSFCLQGPHARHFL